MINLSSSLLFLAVAGTLGYEFKCPDSGEWRLRAVGFNCSIISQYVCIFRYPERAYHETCDGLDYSSTGSKLIYEPFFNKAHCSYLRYQPFPFSTDGSSKCMYQKSYCNERGQYVFQTGSLRSDINCGCDLTRGYKFVTKPKHDCYCIPSEEDCSCHKIPCNNLVQQCPQDADAFLTRSTLTTTRENRINMLGIIDNGKNYRSQCFRIILSLFAVMITVVTLFFTLLKYLLDYFVYQPPSEIQLIQGETVELIYKLLIQRRPSYFYKNYQFLPEIKNIEKDVDGHNKLLRITSVTPNDVGEYCLEVAGYRSRITNLTIQPMFTSKSDRQDCTEGDEIELTCSVYSDSIRVKWYKDNNELYVCTHISIKSNGNSRTLKILETTATDAGKYYVKAKNVEMEWSLAVKAIFQKRLVDMTNMEGLDTKLECKTEEDNCHAQWFKNNVEIFDQQDKMKIERTQGKLHTLFIPNTTVKDNGEYSIKIKGATSSAKLYVKEMPESLRQMSIQDREEFLKGKKSGITRRHNIRVMIIGKQSVGKTCLLRRLMKENINDVRSTDGIERRDCQIDIETGEWHFPSARRESQGSSDHIKQFAECGFWDFAGQREFYATHQTFLSTNAVYILVVDISEDFTTNTYNDMIEKEFDCIGESIEFWLDNIHSYGRDDINTPKDHNVDHLINPPVIIVGTGIDKLAEVEEKKKNFQHYLNRILSTHAKRRHLRKVHFVSNTRPSEDKQEFKSLREDIFRHAKALTTWGENLPTRWIVLEKEINTKSSEHVISYADAENLAMNCSFHDDSQMTLELDSFLKFQHDIGNIIFFEDVRNFIVLDPKWLMDIFRCFVSHQYDNDTIGMPEWSELEQTGKLADTLIEKLLEKVPDLSTPDLKTFVLQIMEKFDIIVRPINYEARNDFYMPCMIKAQPFHNIIGRSESKNDRRTSWFCLKFNFLPPSYFNHILVIFVKHKELFVEQNRRLRIYRNIGEFQLNKSGSQTLVICLSKNGIAMQVRQFNCTADICFSDVKNILMDIVNSVKQRYGINIAYTIKFKCPEGIYNCKRVDLETLMETAEYRCKEHETMHTSKDIYSSWLTKEEVDLESKNKSQRRCNCCKNMSLYKCYDCNTVLCKDCSRKHDNEEKYISHSMQLISDSFILNCTFSLKLEIISDIKCLPNGEVITAQYTEQVINTFSVIGVPRHVIQLKESPLKMTVVDKNTVAVLLVNNSIALVDVHQNHVKYIRSKTISNISDAFMYIENELYIGNEYNIVVLDMSGSVKRCITLSFTPCDMCYNNYVDSQHIYCIDRDTSKLICIDKDGTIIFTFTDPSMTNLTGLTIDKEGNVLGLCKNGNANSGHVIKVDSNGKKSEVVITNINASSPYNSICYDHLTNSVVIELDDTVYIYKRKA